MRASFLSAIIGLIAFSQSAKAEQAQTLAPKQDPSMARIVIKSADYIRGTGKQEKNQSEYVSLPEIARLTMYRYYGFTENNGQQPAIDKDKTKNNSSLNLKQDKSRISGGKSASKAQQSILNIADSLNVEPQFKQAAGVFVTLSSKGKTRACWGSVYPREAYVAKEVVLATLGALSKDYRFKPISSNELRNLKVQVTVIKGLEAVTNIKMINPYKDGIMVRSGGRGGVILPGEAIDAHYEFVLARLKAGIQPSEPCQIYKIRAEIYD